MSKSHFKVPHLYGPVQPENAGRRAARSHRRTDSAMDSNPMSSRVFRCMIPLDKLMTATPIDTYRRAIEKALQAGNATEHTHRPALKTLIESLASGITATNEPKREKCGAPYYVIQREA